MNDQKHVFWNPIDSIIQIKFQNQEIVNGHLGVHGLLVLRHVEMGKNQRPELCLDMQQMVVTTVPGIVQWPKNVKQDNVQLPLIVNGQIGKNMEHAQNHVGEELKPGNELS